MATYEARTGLDYWAKGKQRRVEPGQVVSDLPAEAVGWLLASGAIVDAAPQPAPAEPVAAQAETNEPATKAEEGAA